MGLNKVPTLSCISFAIVVSSVVFIVHGKECLSGVYHKKSAGDADNPFEECQPWQSNSCCTTDFTISLKHHEASKLYNHSWHRCGKLSAQCQAYFVMQECFYQCSPYVMPWQDPAYKGGLKGVPICSQHCDRWYHACKDDFICVENVLSDYDFTFAGENRCPSSKPCVTYAQMYGSGATLCNRMWGDSYVYTRENNDQSNCMTMWFGDGEQNPNANVQKSSASNNYQVGSGAAGTCTAGLMFVVSLAGALLVSML